MNDVLVKLVNPLSQFAVVLTLAVRELHVFRLISLQLSSAVAVLFALSPALTEPVR